jgi:uncharacterized membrane protein
LNLALAVKLVLLTKLLFLMFVLALLIKLLYHLELAVNHAKINNNQVQTKKFANVYPIMKKLMAFAKLNVLEVK